MGVFDVIVVGLGPGGSSAAYSLAQRGHRVLGLEKYAMPRYKPCGGCLSRRIEKILDEDFRPLVEETITRVILSFRGEGEVEIESAEPMAYMVMRDRFDHFLANKAAAAGAKIRDGEPVTSVDEREGHYVVRTGKGVYRCRFLVGADGVNGLVASSLGYRPKRCVAVALEGEVEVRPEVFPRLRNTVRLDVGAIPFGYGWVFPKKDHWSVGVGSGKDRIRHPNEYYSSFLKDQGVTKEILRERRRGFRIPLFSNRRSRIVQGRSLLVGDAAALVDPFLGEGIYYAIRSGQVAAEVLHRALSSECPGLEEYQDRIAREMVPEFEIARKEAEFAFRFTRPAFALFRAVPAVRESFPGLLRGEISYREHWRSVKESGIHALREFLKRTGSPRSSADPWDRMAEQYDAALFLWRQFPGRQAWEQMERLMRSHVNEDSIVLDAGTGTGETLRSLLSVASPSKVYGVEGSRAMMRVALGKVRDPRVRFLRADLQRLPFPDRSFDVVLSAWAIGMQVDPKKAVTEFLRVVKDDGFVIYAFAGIPSPGLTRLWSFFPGTLLDRAFRWKRLPVRERPYHACGQSLLTSHGNGLTTVVVLRKCCSVEPEGLPCGTAAGSFLEGGDFPQNTLHP